MRSTDCQPLWKVTADGLREEEELQRIMVLFCSGVNAALDQSVDSVCEGVKVINDARANV